MLRNDLKRIVGELAKKGTINFNLMDCYNFIDEYCKKHKCNPTENTYEIVNGHLLINDEHIGVVEVISKGYDLTEELEHLDYLEGEFLNDEI